MGHDKTEFAPIKRQYLIQQVVAAMEQSRLVALWGGYGVGKKFIARAAAHYRYSRSKYGSGAFELSLAKVDVADVLAHIASLLNIAVTVACGCTVAQRAVSWIACTPLTG